MPWPPALAAAPCRSAAVAVIQFGRGQRPDSVNPRSPDGAAPPPHEKQIRQGQRARNSEAEPRRGRGGRTHADPLGRRRPGTRRPARDAGARRPRSYEEFFRGYDQDPEEILKKTFEEIEGYDEMIVLRGIRFESHCEHHMAPIIGRAWVGYIPNGRVVGISKLARVVEAYREAPADPGEDDGADREHDREGAAAAGRRRGHQGRAPLHDDARRA